MQSIIMCLQSWRMSMQLDLGYPGKKIQKLVKDWLFNHALFNPVFGGSKRNFDRTKNLEIRILPSYCVLFRSSKTCKKLTIWLCSPLPFLHMIQSLVLFRFLGIVKLISLKITFEISNKIQQNCTDILGNCFLNNFSPYLEIGIWNYTNKKT